ncbi:MAG: two-component sensor histidine kinase [Noviherbaspirillum sp.]|nr:two-component sensor histidine kinase [Noviherbaspirillum sp.]
MMTSIRRTLLLWLFASLAAGIAAAAAVLYIQARKEANEIFDYQMRQLAASLPSQRFVPAPQPRADRPSIEDIIIQIWDESGLRIYHSHEHSDLPDQARLGFSDVVASNGAWRVYSTQLGSTIVQVAQPLSVRSDLAAHMAVRTVAPLFLLFPLLGALIWITVSAGLSPVKRVAREVQARDATTLTPIQGAGLPEEIQPLTDALNDLLGRLSHAIDAQRAFIADAAHELRTPLTALKLQIQLARRAQSEEERRAAFAALSEGFERSMHMVQQLLTLARQEPGTASQARAPVDLAALARGAVADLAVIADARAVDLGVDVIAPPGMPAQVVGDADGLRTMLNNLIDNAVRYTPAGGTVDVTVRADANGVSVEIQDSGPGIPATDLERVFDRFYRVAGTRVEGSGLGLSIVRQIAEANGARVSLENTGKGLRARVDFSVRPK